MHLVLLQSLLFLKENEEDEWQPHFFVLTQNKIFYSEVRAQEDMDGEDEDGGHGLMMRAGSTATGLGSMPGTPGGEQAELHFSEAWFHGNLEKGRETAEQLLKENAHMGDGTFIVRKSHTFIGDYSLSFLRKDKVRVCIRT